MGNPQGEPLLMLHGGPGASCHAGMAAPFDLSRFRLVMVDQRGCGRSRPAGTLRQNTTACLAADMEYVRQHLGITRWHVYGGSWGATLALVYAGSYPHAVRTLLLRSLFLASHREIHHLLGQTRHLRPKAWNTLYKAAQASQPDKLLPALSRRLRQAGAPAWRTAQAYSDLERALLKPYLPPRQRPSSPAAAERQRAKYLIQSHYLQQRCFLTRDQLAQYARSAQAHGITGIALHGRHDPFCPPDNLQWLRRHMPAMQTRLVEAQHLAHEPGMSKAMAEAARQLLGKG